MYRGGSSNGFPPPTPPPRRSYPGESPDAPPGRPPRRPQTRSYSAPCVRCTPRVAPAASAASSARVGSRGASRFSLSPVDDDATRPFPRTSSSSPSSSLMRSITSPGGVSPLEATLAAARARSATLSRRAPPPPHRLWPFPPPLADAFPQTRRARIRPRGPPVSLAKIRARRRGQPRVVRAEASRDRRRASTDSPRGERRVA